jgi:hypothetical protein
MTDRRDPEGHTTRKLIPLNNNNRNNNRRRGRNNRGGQGGGNQGNRIDSRARGNAPQMLEKYKKMAHDASLNGDRVQTEYYLQFADHYFRVIADSRPQRDDQQPQNRARGNDRDQDEYGSDYDNEFEGGANRNERDRGGYRESDENDEGPRASEGQEASEAEEENPFVRESQPRRNNEARNDGRESRPRNGRANGSHPAEPREEESFAGLDPASLPPAIGAPEASDEEEAPRPRRRARKPRATDGGEAIETVG